jgi:hypothetical protein
MVPMTTNPNLKPLMYIMPSRWGFEGAIASERLAIAGAAAWNIDLHKPDLTSLPDYVQGGVFKCAIAQVASGSLDGAWGFAEWNVPWMPAAVLFGTTFAMFVVLLVTLKRRDPV